MAWEKDLSTDCLKNDCYGILRGSSFIFEANGVSASQAGVVYPWLVRRVACFSSSEFCGAVVLLR